MRQPLRYPWRNLDVDDVAAPVIAVRVDVGATRAEVPSHEHRKGQLVFALAGGVTCRVPDGLWIVRETGLTFGRWRQQLHLVVALRELAAGASVQRVSADLGYESVTAFITMFKKALGKPPARYQSSVAQGAR